MKLIWTRHAAADRRGIRDYIAQDNPDAGIALDALISGKAEQLVAQPGIGRPAQVSGTRELVVHRHYILIYAVSGDSIRILRVLHTARRWPPQTPGNRG